MVMRSRIDDDRCGISKRPADLSPNFKIGVGKWLILD